MSDERTRMGRAGRWLGSGVAPVGAAALVLSLSALAAEPVAHFVDVGDGVKLEVLDWGGTGRAVILLAGSGDTGHVYEDFAPKLADCCHVYAITRRGYGASSKPERGYSVPDLAEDTFRVMQSLKIVKPVLVGHSMAGSELSFLGQRVSPELGGLIYLDANADPADFPWSNAEYRQLVTKLNKGNPAPPRPMASDKTSVAAYRAYQVRTGGYAFPAGEIRSLFEINSDGSLGKWRTPAYVGREIDLGSIRKEYGGIAVPVLALVAVQRPIAGQLKEHPAADEQERADKTRLYELEMEFIRRWESNLKKAVPSARIVEMPGAHHYLFLAEEAEILREIRPFLSDLK